MVTPLDTPMAQEAVLTDQQIGRSIVRRLEESPYHELRQVQVEVSADSVLLSGTVATFFLKQLAQETARQACGTRKVINQVSVR